MAKTLTSPKREREHQPAYLCTMTMTDNKDTKGVARYPVGQWPILDPHTNPGSDR